jgi:dCTP deaminase
MTIDLCGSDEAGTIIGWRSRPGSTNVLDTKKFDHEPFDFFEPIYRSRKNEITLTPGVFYILNTKEKIVVPPDFAMEMVNYDPSMGEFRSHFAGFFDPGFGWCSRDEDRGAAAVLEVEAYGHECVIRDAQPICLMRYERMITRPEKIYGSSDLSSNYHFQSGPRLSKWFKQPNVRCAIAPNDLKKTFIEPSTRTWDDDLR